MCWRIGFCILMCLIKVLLGKDYLFAPSLVCCPCIRVSHRKQFQVSTRRWAGACYLVPSSPLETLSIIPPGATHGDISSVSSPISVLHSPLLKTWKFDFPRARCRHKVCSPSIFIMKYSPNKFKLRGRPLPAAYLSRTKIQNWFHPSVQGFLSIRGRPLRKGFKW